MRAGKDPDATARRVLFGGNRTQLIRTTGMTRGTFYNRVERPGGLTLDELARIVDAQGLTPDEIYLVLEVRK